MIGEEEVAILIKTLPKTSFVRNYVRWAANQTDAPLAYHATIAQALLASIAPIDHKLRFAGWQYSPAWCMLVGDTGATRKSTALKLGREILDGVAPEIAGDQPDSTEGLVESLALDNRQTLFFYEFGEFLAKTSQGRLMPMRGLLTELWENEKKTRRLAQSVTTVETPRMSIMGGVAPGMLELHTTTLDYSSGFMSRFGFTYARRERTFDLMEGDPTLQAWLIDTLGIIAAKPVAPCTGFNPAALAFWRTWFASQEKKWARKATTETIGAISRAPTLALKYALVFSLDFGEAGSGKPWAITESVIRVGTIFAEWHLRSTFNMQRFLCANSYQRNCRQVLNTIREDATSYGEIQAHMRMSNRGLNEILESLLTYQPPVIYRSGGILGTGGNEGQTAWYSKNPFVELADDTGNVLNYPTSTPGIGTPSTSGNDAGSEDGEGLGGNGGLPSPPGLVAAAPVPDDED